MERRVREGVDVLITHPRLVQTGLDLLAFPTIAWAEVEYSVYVMRQASRRSWRIGQRHPVRVVYFAYRATLQAQALALVARKLQASLVVEGELGDGGLASHGTEGEDLTLALARSLTGGDEASDESLEALFAGAQQTAVEADAALDAREFAPESVPVPDLTAVGAREPGQRLIGDLLGPALGEQMRLL